MGKAARHAREQKAALHEAWFRAPDGAGASALTFGAPAHGGRYRLVDVVLRSGAGIVSVASMQIGRAQLRETFAEIARRFGATAVPVPVAWARGKLAEARAEHERIGAPLPSGFDGNRDLLGPPPAAPAAHPADAAALDLPDGAAALARSAELHAEPELRGWLPDPVAMQRLLAAIGAALPAALGAGAAEKVRHPASDQAAKEAIDRETDRFFTESTRLDYVERMRDAAIPMIARGERARAADLLAAASAIRSMRDTPPHAIPFFRAFFEKAFGLLAARFAARPG